VLPYVEVFPLQTRHDPARARSIPEPQRERADQEERKLTNPFAIELPSERDTRATSSREHKVMRAITTYTAQAGIFAVGTSAQAWVEFDRRRGTPMRALAAAVASLREPRTTMAGVNLVTGFRPELWRTLVPRETPRRVTGFNHDLVGAGGYVMPGTQHDVALWFAGGSPDVVFDEVRLAMQGLRPVANVAEETHGWPYRQDRDLTGFVDGTENPTLVEAPGVAVIPKGQPGAGGSILLLQKWKHRANQWESLPVPAQEGVIGRTKATSEELDPKPHDSHASRTDQDVFGKIFRRNVAYGTASDHGTIFVGFCSEQRPLARMLESMAGVTDGVRDALTKYTRPLTGSYYFVPCTESVRGFVKVATPG
jgi:putative iron-dependent peroxidase